jgi:HYR domain
MATSRQPNTQAAYPLDARVLALSSLAAFLGWIVASAVGGNEVARVACLTIAPWITAFVASPNLSRVVRVRRVILVLLFSEIAKLYRRGRGTRHSATRRPGTEAAGHGDAGGVCVQSSLSTTNNLASPASAHMAYGWLRHVTLTAAISVAPAAAVLTAHEVTGRNAASAAGPTIRVPDGGVVAHAGSHNAIPVTYQVTAADNAGNQLLAECHPRSGMRFALGKTPVNCSATDADGKRAEAHFAVIVVRGGHLQQPDHETPSQQSPSTTPARQPDHDTPAQHPTHTIPARPPTRTTPAQPPTHMTPAQPPTQTTPAQPPTDTTPVSAPNGPASDDPLSPIDLTGNWHLDYIVRNNSDVYTINLRKFDDLKCANLLHQSPCYGGRWYNLSAKNCEAPDFVAIATESKTGRTFSGAERDSQQNGPQEWAGKGNISARTIFTGNVRQVRPDDILTASFTLTRCDDQTPKDYCLVPPEC